ncbi:MAG TPA: hypothetical protein VK132_09115 [Gemmatimonadales bacterium]|nr:hypothetical protein [Gemmatimonadales bacterium]
MKMPSLCTALVLAELALTSVARLEAQETSLTIYNDGRVLVRRTLVTPVPRGTSEQRLALGALDPATLFALDSGVTITAAAYDGAADEASAIRRALGQTIVFRNGRDTLSATVVGVDPERFRLADGRIVFGRPGQPALPADVVALEPVSRVTLKSDAPRKDLKVGYFTGGADWQASYQAVLGRGSARVTGTAVLGSQSLRARDAEIQLLAGAVSRAAPPAAPRAVMDRMTMLKGALAATGEPSEERVGEFHLYTLPGRTSLEPGTTTSVALFEPASASYERAYVVRGQLPYFGFIPQQGDETDVPVEVSYTLKRARKTSFGDRPLPAGVMRLFQADSAGRLQLVGEASVRHTAPGEEVRVAAGTAFDLTARRVQTAYSTRRDSTRTNGWRTVATADYAVTLSNASDSAATIEVREERAGEWSVLTSSVPAEKISSTITRFRVPVPARGEAKLTYRIRALW